MQIFRWRYRKANAKNAITIRLIFTTFINSALDIDVRYFSDEEEDAEASWAKMKEAVKVSLFKPEIAHSEFKEKSQKENNGFDSKLQENT